MGNLRAQMDALVQGMLASTHERQSFVVDHKARTRSMRSSFSRDHAATAAALKTALSDGCRARAIDVQRMLQGLRRDRERMGRDLRRQLGAEGRAALAKNCQARARAVAELLSEFEMSHGEMSQDLTERLRNFAQGVNSQVFNLKQGFRDALGEIREDVKAAHLIWSRLPSAQAGAATTTPMPAVVGEAEEVEEAAGVRGRKKKSEKKGDDR